MFSIALMLAMQAPAEDIASDPSSATAIKCDGVATTYDKIEKKRPQTRIYILREGAKSVSYWNEGFGAEFNLCDKMTACDVNYAPNQILINGSGGPGGSLTFLADRKDGHMFEINSGYSFRGVCKKVPIPIADTSKNLF